MAIDATQIFALHPDELRIDRAACAAACGLPIPVQSMEQSVWLNQNHAPKIILAGSGMATGGRVVHHLATFGKDPRCTILLSGFQAPATRGATAVVHGVSTPIVCSGLCVNLRPGRQVCPKG